MAGQVSGRPFAKVASGVLMVVALAHAVRFALQLPVTVASVVVPPWLSLPAAIGSGALAVLLWREAQRA
jgi:hypothetical protein